MTDERMMRTWAEVDLDALAHNYNALRQMLNGISRSAGTLPAGIKRLWPRRPPGGR